MMFCEIKREISEINQNISKQIMQRKLEESPVVSHADT